jgi:N-acetyl-gamma-glutamyl-phosphate/LysW-gamma-L-alpha-aminoadipyl-6-phosphate reductase
MRAVVVGAAGYTGGELLRLLLGHPNVDVIGVSSERLEGKRVHTVHPHLRGRSDLTFARRRHLPAADVVFLAMRHGEAMHERHVWGPLAPLVIDLSADFRLRDPDAYRTWYGVEHPDPALLATFVHALPELDRRRIGASDHLAIGGCTATAAILGLYPLVRAGVIDTAQPLIVDAAIGSSAGGAQPGASSHHPHRSGDMRSFAPTGHRHTAEIVQELGGAGSAPPIHLSVTSVEAVRGILATAHVMLNEELDDRAIRAIYREAYRDEPFMRIVKQGSGLHRYPSPKVVTGTNFCDVGFERDPHSCRVVVLSAIDNLTKGAAGQAVHALNVHEGWDETAGLEFGGLYPL